MNDVTRLGLYVMAEGLEDQLAAILRAQGYEDPLGEGVFKALGRAAQGLIPAATLALSLTGHPLSPQVAKARAEAEAVNREAGRPGKEGVVSSHKTARRTGGATPPPKRRGVR